MRARLSDDAIVDVRAAAHGVERAKKALGLAEELHRLAVERYNATVRQLGFDPETFTLNQDGTADGHPPRQG